MQHALDMVMDQLKPEAAYFFTSEGQRSALFFFDLKEVSDIPVVLEPLWFGLEADVELTPVMSYDELKAGISRMRIPS
jgi:hypothetical protein